MATERRALAVGRPSARQLVHAFIFASGAFALALALTYSMPALPSLSAGEAGTVNAVTRTGFAIAAVYLLGTVAYLRLR